VREGDPVGYELTMGEVMKGGEVMEGEVRG